MEDKQSMATRGKTPSVLPFTYTLVQLWVGEDGRAGRKGGNGAQHRVHEPRNAAPRCVMLGREQVHATCGARRLLLQPQQQTVLGNVEEGERIMAEV